MRYNIIFISDCLCASIQREAVPAASYRPFRPAAKKAKTHILSCFDLYNMYISFPVWIHRQPTAPDCAELGFIFFGKLLDPSP